MLVRMCHKATVKAILINLYMYSGLPIPVVAIAAGIANDHYGSENGLVYITTHVCIVYVRTYLHSCV